MIAVKRCYYSFKKKRLLDSNYVKNACWVVAVTLRGERMYLDRLIHLALPRVRDFKELAQKF
jgi:ribosomal protein L5